MNPALECGLNWKEQNLDDGSELRYLWASTHGPQLTRRMSLHTCAVLRQISFMDQGDRFIVPSRA